MIMKWKKSRTTSDLKTFKRRYLLLYRNYLYFTNITVMTCMRFIMIFFIRRVSEQTKSINPFLYIQVVKCVSAGYRHSAAVTEDGELYTWGDGEFGRLGNIDNLLEFIFNIMSCIFT